MPSKAHGLLSRLMHWPDEKPHVDEAVLADIIKRQMPTFHYIGLSEEQIAKAFPAMVVVRVQADDGSKTLRVVVDTRTKLWFALEREDEDLGP